MAILVLSVMPVVFAAGTGSSVGGSIGVEEFEPMVYQCGNRVLIDDDVQPWRITNIGETMVERNQQYLFDGERYQVDVLVFDKNKIQDDMVDLVLEGEERCVSTCNIDSTCQTICETFDDKTINCVETNLDTDQFADCNARIGEEQIAGFDSNTMQAYTCTIDVLDSENMYGLYTLKVRAVSGLTDAEGAYDEIARWFMNPVISLSVDGYGDLDFNNVRPGTSSYSAVLLENTAEGGVLLDMFITGNNWDAVADNNGNLGRCWDGTQYVNYLPLSAFSYYAENGAFSTREDGQVDDNNYDSSITRTVDAEGYVNIHRQLNAGFEEAMFDEAEIIQANAIAIGSGKNAYLANLLYPGSAGMSVTMRLNLPEPCYGEYASNSEEGSIFFWAEAV